MKSKKSKAKTLSAKQMKKVKGQGLVASSINPAASSIGPTGLTTGVTGVQPPLRSMR
jgi:hypothetical protein